LDLNVGSERVPSSSRSEPLDINKDQGKSSNVADEIAVLDESNTHTTYQKIKDAVTFFDPYHLRPTFRTCNLSMFSATGHTAKFNYAVTEVS
jgi:hypothetical protein